VTKTAGQSLLLAVLLVLLGVIVVWQMRTPAPAVNTPAASNPEVTDNAATGSAGAVTDVQIERLSAEPVAFATPRRDPFRFRPQAPPPEVVRPAVPQTPLPPPTPPGPPPREPISSRIRLLGIYELGTRRIAVLHDGTPSPPMHGVEGDVIQGQYRLVRVLPNAVELAYLDGGSPQSIPLPGR
jgi:hypothetical protein